MDTVGHSMHGFASIYDANEKEYQISDGRFVPHAIESYIAAHIYGSERSQRYVDDKIQMVDTYSVELRSYKGKKKHIAMQFNGCNFCQFQHYHNNNYFRAVHNEILDRIDDRKNGAEYQDEISCQFTFDNMRQSKHVSAESNIQLLR